NGSTGSRRSRTSTYESQEPTVSRSGHLNPTWTVQGSSPVGSNYANKITAGTQAREELLLCSQDFIQPFEKRTSNNG
ncbi:unnamed protein product, partial [Allacma fusca]